MAEQMSAKERFAVLAGEYQIVKKHAEALGADVATAGARVWLEELNARYPDVTYQESDLVIEVSFGTDPSAIVGLQEQLKAKGLQLDHVQKDPFGLRLCCTKVPEGDLPAPRTTIIGA